MSRVFAGDLTYVEAAKLFNLPSEVVFACFTNHWQMESSETGISLKPIPPLETSDDFVAHLRGLLKKFTKRLDEAMKTLEISAYNESAVTRLSAELRACMRDILEFEGKLKSAPVIQLNYLQVQMTNLTSFLFSELCEHDRQKLMERLPELVMNGQSIRKTPENLTGPA
jgi:hypothetical protein